jgi:two-component system chemotaxis response regulator CheB
MKYLFFKEGSKISSSIKVLVVDDSALMRRIISDLLTEDPSLQVIGTASNGVMALQKIEALNPDVVTLDVEMPVMDGLTTLKLIMQQKPLPVIMLSSLTQAGSEITIKALQEGAVDFVPKPSGNISLDLKKVQNELIAKVKIASCARIHKSLVKKNIPGLFSSFQKKKEPDFPRTLVLIGTSTGGPKALNELLPKFPVDLPAAILIVQHMPAGFTRSLAERLDQNSAIHVKEAEDKEIVVAGTAYIAPGGYHLQVRQNSDCTIRLHLDESDPINGHRPSVDALMLSASKIKGHNIVGVILTGMGRDGCEGICALKEKGAYVIAEDETTAVVYGMPKAVVEAQVVDRLLHAKGSCGSTGG